MGKFISMISCGEEIVDFRKLQIEFHFSQAAQVQLNELVKFCALSCMSMLDDAFYLEWRLNDRRVKGASLFDKIAHTKDIFSLDFRGNVRTAHIYDHKTLKKYHEELFHKLNMGVYDPYTSPDYWPVYHRLFDNVTDPEEVRQNLLKLFRIENVYCKQPAFGDEVVCTLFSCPYFDAKNLYHGDFGFRIALPCLGEHLLPFSNKAVDFLKGIVDIVPNVSGNIMLSPTFPPSYCSSYMSYFGGSIKAVPSGKISYMRDHEWIQAYYLRGVEWYNLLSPTQTRILNDRKHSGEIVTTQLSNGSSLVTVKKDILQTQVSDLCILKQYLYPVLYPGSIKIPIHYLLDPQAKGHPVKPRKAWENIPVLEHEVEVDGDNIILKYQSNYLDN